VIPVERLRNGESEPGKGVMKWSRSFTEPQARRGWHPVANITRNKVHSVVSYYAPENVVTSTEKEEQGETMG